MLIRLLYYLPMERMMDLDEMFRKEAEKYKNSKSVEVYEEQLEGWFKIIDELREENKNLKSDLAYERTMLDNVKAEYESSQNVIKNLKDKIEHLEFDIKAWKILKVVWEKKEQELQIEIGGLMGERDGLQMVVERLHKEIEEQDEENKKLREELRYYKEKSEFQNKVIVKYQEENPMGFTDFGGYKD